MCRDSATGLWERSAATVVADYLRDARFRGSLALLAPPAKFLSRFAAGPVERRLFLSLLNLGPTLRDRFSLNRGSG